MLLKMSSLVTESFLKFHKKLLDICQTYSLHSNGVNSLCCILLNLPNLLNSGNGRLLKSESRSPKECEF